MLPRIVDILVKRDKISKEEAEHRCQLAVEEARTMAADNNLTLSDLEDIIADNFGLEPDYVEDMLEHL